MLLLLLSCFSHIQLCETPQTATHQAPLSMGVSRQEYCSGLPLPSPGILLTQRLNPPLLCLLLGQQVLYYLCPLGETLLLAAVALLHQVLCNSFVCDFQKMRGNTPKSYQIQQHLFDCRGDFKGDKVQLLQLRLSLPVTESSASSPPLFSIPKSSSQVLSQE